MTPATISATPHDRHIRPRRKPARSRRSRLAVILLAFLPFGVVLPTVLATPALATAGMQLRVTASPNELKCLDIAGGATGDYGILIQWPCGVPGQTNQEFTGQTRKQVGSNYYYNFSPQNAPNECLDVAQSFSGNGGNVITYHCFFTDNQLWRIIPHGTDNLGNSVFSLQNLHSGRCLDIPAQTFNQNGIDLQQWDCSGQYPQLFTATWTN